MARPDKAAAVAELTDAFRNANAAVLTEYRGLTVAQLKALRRSLSGNAEYFVVKNTLTKIAAKEAGVDAFDSLLQGPSAIAFVSGDAVEVAKGLRDFAKANPLLVIKGGVLDGKALSAAEVSKLADLESREVLLAKLAGAMVASLSQAAALFQAPLSQAARTIEALRAQVEATGGPAAAAPAAPDAGTEAGTDASTPEEAAAEAATAGEPAVEASAEAVASSPEAAEDPVAETPAES
jgi:large subunit ribosomal protein L10